MAKNPVYRPETEVVGDLLYESRTSQRLSQLEVAKKLGRAQQFLSKVEKHKTAIQFVVLLDLLKVLNYDPHQFLDDLQARMNSAPKRATKRMAKR